MSGKGLDNVPIRWPDRWDPAFMDRLFREVLAKADIRNAIEGLGISITGLSDEFATLSASEDVQALIDASLLTSTDESANLDNVRRLVAGSPGITVTDNGPGLTLAVDIGVIPWGKLGDIPDLSVIGVATSDDGFSPVQPIQSSTNNTVLRRASDTLSWSQIVYADIEDATAVSVVGRSANSSGVLADIPAGTNDTLLRQTGDTLNWGTITAGMLADVDTDALAEGATNLYFTDERAQDAVGTILADSSSIDFTYTDATPEITAAVIPGGVNHNALLNYVADQHVAHSGVDLTAGAGLTGGGTIEASRSFAVGAGTGIAVNADDVALSASSIASLALADSAAQPGDNVSIFANDAGYLTSVVAANVDSEAATNGQVLIADGAGNAAWGDQSGGGATSLFDLNDVDADPNADRIPFWDDSDATLEWISEIPDGFLSSNVPLLNTSNDFTGQAIEITSASSPFFRATDTTNTVQALFQSQDSSARAGTFSNHAFRIISNNTDRITIAADGSEIQFDATLFDFNGNSDFSGSNAFTALGTGAGSPIALISSAPNLAFIETDAAANNGTWDFRVQGESLLFRVVNDASTAATTFLTVSRTDNTVDEIQYDATLHDMNGNLDADGTTMDIDGSTSLGLHGGSCDLSLSGTTASLTGDLTATGDGTFNTSDIRLKRNLVPIGESLGRLKEITPYTFEKQSKGVWRDARMAGVIAQDVEAVLPEAIKEQDGYKFVSGMALTALLVGAVNELRERVEAME